MNLEDLLEQFICDRIALLMKDRPEESIKRDMELCECQDKLMQGFNIELKEAVEHFLDDVMMQSEEDGRYLYLSGISDGIRISRTLMKL